MTDLRTKICIWIMIIGVANFLAYTIGYTIVGGESIHGKIEQAEQSGDLRYYLASDDAGKFKEVSRTAFVYIGIHSISIWLTVAGIILAMLTLAKDRIADSMQSAAMRGRTLCTVLAVVTAFSTAGLTFQFIRQFIHKFEKPRIVSIQQDSATRPAPKSATSNKSAS